MIYSTIQKLTVFLFSLLVLVLTASITKAQSSSTNSGPLALTNVNVIDVVEGKVLPNQTVIITGNRITGVGHTDSLKVPGHAKVINAKGKYLIPGLWDMHVHLDDKPGLHFTAQDKKITLDLLATHGITGVRDMGGNLSQLIEWKRQAGNREIIAPRIVAAGPYVDGEPAIQPYYSMSVGSEQEAKSAVRSLSRKPGVDFIKVYSNLSREAYFAIAEEANKLGIPFAGHLPRSIKFEEAIEAGQRSFEHADPLTYLCTEQAEKFHKIIQDANGLGMMHPKRIRASMIFSGRDKEVIASFDPAACDDLLTQLGNASTWVTPTHTVFKGITHYKEPPPENDPRYQTLHPGYKNLWHQRVNVIPDTIAQKPSFGSVNQAWFESRFKITKALHDAGVALLAGTDMPDLPYIFPASSLHDELGFMVRAGLTPAEALRTATINPAQYLGRDYEMGTIAVDNFADLVLLDENPLADIENVRKINAVILRGQLLNRAALDAMFNDVKTKVQEYKKRDKAND